MVRQVEPKPPELMLVAGIMMVQAGVIFVAGLAVVVAGVNVYQGQTGDDPQPGWWVPVCLILLIPAVVFVGLAIGAWRGSRVGLVLSMVVEILVLAAVSFFAAPIIVDAYRYGGAGVSSFDFTIGLLLASAGSAIVGALVGLRRHGHRRSPGRASPPSHAPQ